MDLNPINELFYKIWIILEVLYKQPLLGDSLSKEVFFNRIDRKIYAPMPGLGKKKMQEMEFAHNDNGNKDKFYKVIRLIERRFNATGMV